MSRQIANPMEECSIETGRRAHSLKVLSRRAIAAALWLSLIGLTIGSAHAQDGNGVCRVNTTGTSGNTGSTWAQAMNLPSALGNAACNEIWVAAGAYKPTIGSDRTATFAIRSGVAVYGGFDGSENARNERDPAVHRSVLSGDIGGDDVVDAHGVTASATDIVGDNSDRVVSLGDASAATTLDGFTITGGSDSNDGGGSGLICMAVTAGQNCSPTLRNLVFRGNGAPIGGGTGGGMACVAMNQGKCAAALENIAFVGNAASFGDAMANVAGEGGNATPSLRNVTFIGNSSGPTGLAFVNLAASGGIADAALTNVTFFNTTMGILNLETATATSNATLVNAIVWGGAPGEFVAEGGTLSISHSIVQGGCPLGATCTDMIAGDPKLGTLQDAGGVTPVLLPGMHSTALDAGTCTDAPSTDPRGIARPQGAGCDIGAVEVRQAQLTVEVSGAGKVDAVVAPVLLGAAIADCRQDSGSCSAWYRVEPDAPVIFLSVHPDAGNVVQSANGCGGSLVGNHFITAALDNDCTLEVVFAPPLRTVGGTVTGLAGSGLVLELNGNEDLPIAADGIFTFDTTITGGNAYLVTIDTQPSQPSQACVVINGSGTVGASAITNVVIHCGAAVTYSVGGTLSGLAPGASIALSINGGNHLVLAANGAYVFAPRFAPGDSYVAIVTAQPADQHCTLSHAEGTVGSANVSDINLACMAGGAQLQLSVTDGGNYARYGQVRDYFITLSNTGNDSATNVVVSADLDPAFDAANVQWACVGGAPGTACTAQGSAGFADTATLPPGTSLVWILRVPIYGDSNAANATVIAHASGAPNASDTNTLVIFRDGLDVPYADGAGVEDPAQRDAALEGGDVASETDD